MRAGARRAGRCRRRAQRAAHAGVGAVRYRGTDRDAAGARHLVLALRTADGQPLVESADGGAADADALIMPKLGSVVIAIPAEHVEEFAGAALSSTFYLALAIRPRRLALDPLYPWSPL